MGIPLGEEEKGIETIFEVIVTENCLNLTPGAKPQIQEAQKTPDRITVKSYTQVYYIDIAENER